MVAGGLFVAFYDHFAAGYVDFVFQLECYTLRREGVVKVAVVGCDTLYATCFSRGECHYFVAPANDSRSYFAAEASEVEVGSQDVLYGEAEVFQVVVAFDVYVLEELQDAGTFVPRCAVAAFHHVVSFERREGDALHIRHSEGGDEGTEFGHDIVEDFAEKSTRSILFTASTMCLMPSSDTRKV